MLILPEIWSSPVYTFFFISRRVNSPPPPDLILGYRTISLYVVEKRRAGGFQQFSKDSQAGLTPSSPQKNPVLSAHNRN